MNWKKTLLICVVILAIAGGATALIFMTEPTAQREGATRESAMLVEVTTAEHGNFRPKILATGVVQAEQDIMLSPRVSGEIVWRSPDFTPGNTVRKGAALLRIDAADYQNALEMEKTELRQALSGLDLELGRQDVARKDYELFNDTLSADNKALVLREPQLKAAEATVEAARVAVSQAELALDRTVIRAPFDAQVIVRNANVGSQVAPGEDLGRLVGIDEYWVALSVPMAQLQRLSFPAGGKQGAEVRIRSRTAWEPEVYRIGHVDKLIGALDEQTRLATVLVAVEDPLARRRENAGAPPLIIGAFVEAEITADEISGVVRLKREHLRKDDSAWVMEDGKLGIRELDIVFRGDEYVYVRNGLEQGDQIVTTNLATVVEGVKLRLDDSENNTKVDSTRMNDQQSDGSQTTGGSQ